MPPESPAIARLLALGGELAPPAPGLPRRKFDLAHMRALLQALGNPHLRFPSVLIAGTNGKGSTAAILAAILQAAGHRTGLYTSPHLEHPAERIRVDGLAIPEDTLASLFQQVEAATTRLAATGALPHMPSFFEVMTAIAFLHFAKDSQLPEDRGQTTIAILEVGLGGRLDATNVVEPLISVITDISLDHTEWLGPTIAAITREKAGILRPHGILVTLPQHPEANQVIGEVAVPLEVQAINAADYLPPRDSEPPSEPETLKALLRNRYSLTLPPGAFDSTTIRIDSPLAGAHQQRNIALALAAAVTLHQQHGFALTPQALERGFRNTAWPGRLQLLHPPAGQRRLAPVLLDAAHNPAGAWTLRAALSPLPIAGPRTLVFGCMADKAIDELAQILFPIFDTVLLTRAPGPRAAALADLAAAAERTGTPFRTFADPAEALAAAQSATPANGLVAIAGSVALLGALLPSLSSWSE